MIVECLLSLLFTVLSVVIVYSDVAVVIVCWGGCSVTTADVVVYWGVCV